MNGKATRHSQKRVKSRMGLGKGAVNRQADLAIERGIRHKNTDGRLHKWITKQAHFYSERREDVAYIVYNNQLFVFNEACSTLITVLNLPTNLQKLAQSQIKKVQDRV